ncbi:MAG: hypothetical protein AABY68_02335 [Pseudomonadota bacterium]
MLSVAKASETTGTALDVVSRSLKPGHVYRREDLARVSNAVDRHLRELVSAGQLKKLAQGLYYAPRQSVFGSLPPEDAELVRGFLRDRHFLVFSPSAYNTVGLGTTQLYNRTVVYNHKRHGVFMLGNRQFDFRVKPRFPEALTAEFLFVDMLNNLDALAEDVGAVWQRVAAKVHDFQPTLLQEAVMQYGKAAVRKKLEDLLHVSAAA